MQVLTGAIEAEIEAGPETVIDATLDVIGLGRTATEVIITEVAAREDPDQNLLATTDTTDLA